MLYYRVPNTPSGCLVVYNHCKKEQEYLISRELLTAKELERLHNGNLKGVLECVEISKFDTFTSFGVRFQKGTTAKDVYGGGRIDELLL